MVVVRAGPGGGGHSMSVSIYGRGSSVKHSRSVSMYGRWAGLLAANSGAFVNYFAESVGGALLDLTLPSQNY